MKIGNLGCAWALLVAMLTLASCGNNDEPIDDQTLSRTVLIYMACDNNLASWAAEDFEEICAGVQKTNPAKECVLVYYDTGENATLLRVTHKDGKARKEVVREYALPRNSVGREETIEVFQDAFGGFPADGYGLVYWSHGDGWIPQSASTRWIGQDYNGKFMDLDQFEVALTHAPHLDFLLFDCCFMQSVEVAYELRSRADYFIGSPTETPGSGAYYVDVIPACFASDIGAALGAAYYHYYDNYFDNTLSVGENRYMDNADNWVAGASVSVIKSSALEPLAQATRQMLEGAEVPDMNRLNSMVFNYDKRSKSSSSSGFVGYYDLQDCMESVSENQAGVEQAYEEWTDALDDAVVYWTTTPTNYSSFAYNFSMTDARCGMSLFIPKRLGSSALTAYRQLKWYQDAGIERLGW